MNKPDWLIVHNATTSKCSGCGKHSTMGALVGEIDNGRFVAVCSPCKALIRERNNAPNGRRPATLEEFPVKPE